MTAATFRGSAPTAAPATAKPAAKQKGFWARTFDALIKARQAEIEAKVARYAREGRIPPQFYI